MTGDSLESRVAAQCAEALGCSPARVQSLRDDADLLPALLACLVLELRSERRPAPMGAESDPLVEAARDFYRVEPFTCDQVLWDAEDDAALAAAIAGRTAHQLGARLRDLAKAGGIATAGRNRRGATLWQVLPDVRPATSGTSVCDSCDAVPVKRTTRGAAR